MNEDNIEEITNSITIDGPDGEMSLQEVMLDLAMGHNEMERWKNGALNLHSAIEDCLEEERNKNPDSPVIEILEDVEHSAFGLYLRIERGDEELNGHRDGEYSGYFNNAED